MPIPIFYNQTGATRPTYAVRATANSNITQSGLISFNGITVVNGDKVLCTSQTDPLLNGIWVAGTGAWTRDTNYDTSAKFVAAIGQLFYHNDGTNAGTYSVFHGSAIESGTRPTFVLGSKPPAFSKTNLASFTLDSRNNHWDGKITGQATSTNPISFRSIAIQLGELTELEFTGRAYNWNASTNRLKFTLEKVDYKHGYLSGEDFFENSASIRVQSESEQMAEVYVVPSAVLADYVQFSWKVPDLTAGWYRVRGEVFDSNTTNTTAGVELELFYDGNLKD